MTSAKEAAPTSKEYGLIEIHVMRSNAGIVDINRIIVIYNKFKLDPNI